jgi:hypothetical protein
MFSDLAPHETTKLRGFKMDHAKANSIPTGVFDVSAMPESIDWRA